MEVEVAATVTTNNENGFETMKTAENGTENGR
jgi:hypothetical protein